MPANLNLQMDMLRNAFRSTYKRKVFLYDGECLRLLAAREHMQFLGEPVYCKPECDLRVSIKKTSSQAPSYARRLQSETMNH